MRPQVAQHGALSQQLLELRARGFELSRESERLRAVLEAPSASVAVRCGRPWMRQKPSRATARRTPKPWNDARVEMPKSF